MFEILKCTMMIGIYLVLYAGLGHLMGYFIKYKLSLPESIVIGFFGYFALFQLIALPLILLKQPLTLLIGIWSAVLVCLLVLFGYVLYKEKIFVKRKDAKRSKKPSLKKADIICLMMLGAFVLFLCYFTVIQNYWGWDTAFYIGTVNTTVDSNTMYLINGESGKAEHIIPMRYALSTFYMNSAVACKITGISAVMFQKYVISTLCVVLYQMILYLIGKRLFKGEIKRAVLFAIMAGMLNFFFVSEYTTSHFLLFRAYEAKAYCANVVIPAVFLIILMLHEEIEKKENWLLLFWVMTASVPVSMSSILIVPVLAGVALLGELLITKKVKIIKYGIVCMIPNGIYLVVYLLYTLQLFEIKV